MSAAPAIAVAYDSLFPYTKGGGERQYRAFAEDFVRRGFEVDYVTSQQWDAATPPNLPGIRVLAATPPLALYDGAGVRTSGSALRFAGGLMRTLLRNRRRYSAVIVSGLPVLNVFAARAALAFSGTSLVVDYLEVWGRRQWIAYTGRVVGSIAWALQRAAIALTPMATCHSRMSEARLRAEGFRGRVLVSPGLIDAASVPAPEATLPEGPPRAIYVGRHIPDKRVESLPAALVVARREIPDLEAVILGDGPTSREVGDAVDAAGATNWVSLPGFVSDAELTAQIAGASVLVNPSRREGYGLVVVEAASQGTPVVLVHDPDNAATELIEDGVNGFVAESTDPEELGRAIVAAVSGGPRLRASTRAWYEDASRTRTIALTVEAIVVALDLDPDRPSRREVRRSTHSEAHP